MPYHCQGGAFALAGYFTVTAYSPSIMAIVNYPATGKVKLADCGAAELILAHDVEPPQIGWVSFGNKPRGIRANGCNPLLAPCAGEAVPVRETTWGRLKTYYR